MTAADEASCVRRVSVLRANLGQVFGPPLHVPQRRFAAEPQFGRLEAAATLVGAPLAGHVDRLAGVLKLGFVRRRQAVQIVVGHAVVARVVVAADEDRGAGDLDAVVGHQFPHAAVVSHLGKGPGVRAAPAAGAGAAVVRRLVRVVHARRAMPANDHHPRESRRQTHVAQQTPDDGGHLVDAVADAARLRSRLFRTAFQLQLRDRGSADIVAKQLSQLGSCPREQDPHHQRNRGERAEHRSEGPARKRAAADMHAVRDRADRAAPLSPFFFGLLEGVDDVLDDEMLRLDHDRAERRVVRVGGTAVVHRHGKEPRRPERFAGRSNLLQVPAERFFALVDAADDLKCRRCGRRPLAILLNASAGLLEPTAVVGHGVQRFRAIVALERQVIDTPPMEAREFVQLANQQRPLGVGQADQQIGPPSDQLGQLKDQERPLFDADLVVRADSLARGGPQPAQRTTIPQRFVGHVGQRHAVQQQANRQELNQAACRQRPHGAVAPGFNLPDHAGKAAQGQQRLGEIVFAFVRRHAQQGQRLVDGLERRNVALGQPAQFRPQPPRPAIGDPDAAAEQCQERLVEPCVAAGQRPVREPLIEKRRTKWY